MQYDELLGFRRRRLTSWLVPDDVVFIDEVPRTGVGKFFTKPLRDRFADHVPPSA
jgi:fatty-acyl-CoA synthase